MGEDDLAVDAFPRGVSTCAMKAISSASDANSVAWPEMTCSTRPVSCVGVSGVPSRSCTTNAQDGDSGAMGGGVALGSTAFVRRGLGGLDRCAMVLR